MAPLPKLVPAAPTRGEPVEVDRSPWWIGSSAGSALRVYLPGVADRHASITEREDGYYLSPMPGAAIMLNGRPVSAATRLADGVIVEISPAARWEFVTGEPRIVAAPEPEEEAAPEYETLEPSGKKMGWSRRRRIRSNRAGFPLWGWAAILLLVAALGFGIRTVVTALRSGNAEPETPAPITATEQQLYDSLMVESTRNVERGATLLDLGLPDEALRQFALAINVLEVSDIGRSEWVQPSINTIIQTVRDIYAAYRLNPPSGIRGVRGKLADLSKTLGANLTSDQFQNAVATVGLAFKSAFNDTIVVTGRDHPEHVSLYGRGSAMDIRVRNLTRDQVTFLVASFLKVGVRVKDFSTDDVLQAQIAAARARGWNDRAGTGLHLHIDRFRDRRDAYTVGAAPGG
ncbi:MAG: FHA domain-containing protein [Gemmatimonadales bacterium]